MWTAVGGLGTVGDGEPQGDAGETEWAGGTGEVVGTEWNEYEELHRRYPECALVDVLERV